MFVAVPLVTHELDPGRRGLGQSTLSEQIPDNTHEKKVQKYMRKAFRRRLGRGPAQVDDFFASRNSDKFKQDVLPHCSRATKKFILTLLKGNQPTTSVEEISKSLLACIVDPTKCKKRATMGRALCTKARDHKSP